jgi:predicted PurR-regulated permease PerM
MASRDPDTGRRTALLLLGGAVVLWLLWMLRSIVMLVAFASLIAYILDPLVSALERLRLPSGRVVPRAAAAGIVVLALVVLLGWLVVFAVPHLAGELVGFVQRLPANLQVMELRLRQWATANHWDPYVGPALDGLRANTQTLVPQIGAFLLGWVGRMFGNLIQVLGLLVLPVLAFYLLAEYEAVRASLLRFVPPEARERVLHSSGAVDRAMRSYVRGQALVCLISGLAVGPLLAALGVPNALLLGVLVGLAEIVPYLGFALAAIAIGISGISVSPLTAVLGIAAYVVVNNLIGLLVTPRVMGRYLKMHPFVVIVSVLAGAELLGPPGVILALPGAAVIQSLIEEFAPPAARRRSAA